MISVRTKLNSKSLSASIRATERAIGEATIAGGLKAAQRLRDAIRSNARHRPGPTVDTGEYVASWKIRKNGSLSAGVTSWSVFTNDPAGPPLEFGRIGSHPYPHVQVAVDENRDLMINDYSSTLRAVQ